MAWKARNSKVTKAFTLVVSRMVVYGATRTTYNSDVLSIGVTGYGGWAMRSLVSCMP